MKGISDSDTLHFEKIIGIQNRFIIPKFQRDYSWDIEQWDDLWQDIEVSYKENEPHYMGYLVLQNDGQNKNNYVIDGQQRFTTITLIILAAIKAIKNLISNNIEVEKNQERIDTLLNTYIGNKDPISLQYDNILELNRNNNGYYRDYIVPLGELRNRHLLASEKLMKNCFEFYEKKLIDKFSKGEDYAEFIKSIVTSLFFTVITVNDELNAFKVFETLNARGVQLSSSDLLKNYFFSLIDKNSLHTGRIADLEEQWLKLTSNIQEQKLAEFLRYYWNSKNKTIRKNGLFKEIRKQITKDTQVFEIIKEMLSYSDIYMALQDPLDEYWENNPILVENIGLLKLFGIKQAYPLLMAANKKLESKSFEKILKHVVKISFRYNIICGKNPNDIEKVYNEIANDISSKNKYDKALLKSIYIDEDEFKSLFSNKTFIENSRNTKVVKYILLELEKNISGAKMDMHGSTTTIEHILPQHPNQDWKISHDDAERYAIRLGNMCLLEKNYNKESGSKDYNIKKGIYAKSYFESTKKISATYDEWTLETINERQATMATIAEGIWKIVF